MRLAVSGNGYASATNEFLDANCFAAAIARTLTAELAHSTAMAGHTAADWAASYDQAAREGVASLADLVGAVANLGRMTDATRRNHATAEQRAVIGRPRAQEVTAAPPYTFVTARQPPTAAGTHGTSSMPDWATWILDKVEGFVWPDSDIDRLRGTSRAWLAAAHQLGVVADHCDRAATSLSVEMAPDVSMAAGAARRLAAQVDGLASTFRSIANSCDDLADQVHQHREAVLKIVRDTVRDAVIIEGIGIVLGAVTGGITAAAATSVNTARIAAIAPKIIRVIDALRIAIGASETGARLAADTVIEARADFQTFLKARIILTSSERGCVRLPLGKLATEVEERASRQVPATTDPKLGNYVRNLFKGVTREDRVGDGTTMDAIRHERATGLMTQGKMHTMKGEETLRGLQRWLRTHSDVSTSDIALANQLISELKDALG